MAGSSLTASLWPLGSRQSSAKTGKLSERNRQQSESVSRLFSFLASQHPTKTAEAVAANIGISADAVTKWRDGATAPSYGVMWALFDHYGPELLAAIYAPGTAPGWLDAAAAEAEHKRLVARRDDAIAKLALARARAARS